MSTTTKSQLRTLASHFPTTPLATPTSIIGGSSSQKYRFTLLTPGLLRYEYSPTSKFNDRASVLAINRQHPTPQFTHHRSTKTGILEIVTEKFHLSYVEGEEFSASTLSVGIKGRFGCHSSEWRYGLDFEGAEGGGGTEEGNANLGGTARTLDGVDGRCELGRGVCSRRGYVAIDDSESMVFDGEGFVASRKGNGMKGEIDGYLFAYGHDYEGAVKALYMLSGKQPLLPRWALGNWWSRYYRYTDDEYLKLMDRFADEGLPFSVAVIDMDWHVVDGEEVDESGKTGWTGYTWNKELFPDPEGFLKKLHERKLMVTLNDHPADGVQAYEELYPAMADFLEHATDSKAPIHFDITDPNFLAAFLEVLHRPLEKQGVDFWWVDWQQGEHSRIPGIDPLWVLNHFHFIDNKLHFKRPLTFSRYAGPGSHRYPVGFSGDSIVTWASLAFQPEFTATASNIGYGWWSHDIGGHMGGVKDDELTARWVQLGCFSPISRLHSSNSQWTRKEPWTYGPAAANVMTEALRFRHRLMPYLYTMNARSAMEGTPLVRPMYWAYPERDEAYSVPNQYLFGSELIVIPITAPQDPKLRLAKTKGWLPPGKYVDIFTGAKYDGNRALWISRRLEDYPVFAKEGSIIPLDAQSVPGNGGEIAKDIEVLVVVGADGEFELLEDDGTKGTANDVKWAKTLIKYTQATGTLTIESNTPRIVPKRAWTVTFLGMNTPHEVKVSYGGKAAQDNTWDLAKNSRLQIYLNAFDKSELTWSVSLGANPQLGTSLKDAEVHIRPILADAQIDFWLKEEVWRIVNSETSAVGKVSGLHALDMEENLRDAVLEHILAH